MMSLVLIDVKGAERQTESNRRDVENLPPVLDDNAVVVVVVVVVASLVWRLASRSDGKTPISFCFGKVRGSFDVMVTLLLFFNHYR